MPSFDIPYSAQISKNQKNYNPRTGRYYANSHKKAVKAEISWIMRQHRGLFTPKMPVFIVVTVFRKHTRTDPHNFVEVVADGVSEGIGVDDCHFEIYSRAEKVPEGRVPFIRVNVLREKKELLNLLGPE